MHLIVVRELSFSFTCFFLENSWHTRIPDVYIRVGASVHVSIGLNFKMRSFRNSSAEMVLLDSHKIGKIDSYKIGKLKHRFNHRC